MLAAPQSTGPANIDCSSWSSARVFRTSEEGPRRSGGCWYHSTNSECCQEAPVTIHGRKWTGRALPLARITSGAIDDGRSAETSSFDPRIADCMGGGRGRAAPMSGLRCRQTWSLPKDPTWSRSMSASAKTPVAERRRPGLWTARGPLARDPCPGAQPPPASPSSGRGSHGSCRTCPGGAGSITYGLAVSQGWRSVRTTPWRAVPGTARLVFERQIARRRVATVGAALLPT